MIKIITDSAADFEPEELEQLDVTCIPLTVMFGDAEYQENINLSKDQFYRLLEQSADAPKTAQASPQILTDLFEAAHASGDEAIYITLSSQLSGTYQNAMMARNTLDYDTCHVVDSKNATGGQRMLVEHAVRLRDQGKAAAEIIQEVEALQPRIVLYACMDTLEYLYRGGRISHTTYTLGSLAQVKPILRVETDGSLSVPTKVMGMKKGVEFLAKRLALYPPDSNFPLYVMYTDDRTNGQALAAKLKTLGLQIPDDRIINVGAAIGSHIGPKACGLVYIHSELPQTMRFS